MNSKKLVIIMSVFVVLTGIVMLPAGAYAQGTSSPTRMNFFQNLIQFISDKLGLDKNKVQSVIGEFQQQQKQKMLQNWEAREKARLDQLVKDGKITSVQETAIITELTALRTKYAQNSSESPQQRMTLAQNMKNELKAWAQSQGIDITLIQPGFGMGKGVRAGMRNWGKWSSSSSVSSK